MCGPPWRKEEAVADPGIGLSSSGFSGSAPAGPNLHHVAELQGVVQVLLAMRALSAPRPDHEGVVQVLRACASLIVPATAKPLNAPLLTTKTLRSSVISSSASRAIATRSSSSASRTWMPSSSVRSFRAQLKSSNRLERHSRKYPPPHARRD